VVGVLGDTDEPTVCGVRGELVMDCSVRTDNAGRSMGVEGKCADRGDDPIIVIITEAPAVEGGVVVVEVEVVFNVGRGSSRSRLRDSVAGVVAVMATGAAG
jgi:hypothetical protein